MRKIIVTTLFTVLTLFSYGQSSTTGSNYISTAVPFLTITPDARTSGMGDVGVATPANIYSMFCNPSKYAFIENKKGMSISYTPWLKKFTNNITLAYVTGFYKIDKRQTIASSFRYFNMGEIVFTDINANELSTQTPNEFAIDFAYSRKLSENFSMGITFRYISSNLTLGQNIAGQPSKKGNSVAVDLSCFYSKNINRNTWTWGLNISNIGSKISYSKNGEKYFLPSNLRLGSAYIFNLDNQNYFTIAVDINKILVPTPKKTNISDKKGTITIGGYSSDNSPIKGLFSSFSDAEGGFSEEFKEITWSLGFEYSFKKHFFLRTGYLYENQDKGNRNYLTFGLGLIYNKNINLDLSYLVPTISNSPLSNTLRLSLGFVL